jgi:hypothetical protein
VLSVGGVRFGSVSSLCFALWKILPLILFDSFFSSLLLLFFFFLFLQTLFFFFLFFLLFSFSFYFSS